MDSVKDVSGSSDMLLSVSVVFGSRLYSQQNALEINRGSVPLEGQTRKVTCYVNLLHVDTRRTSE